MFDLEAFLTPLGEDWTPPHCPHPKCPAHVPGRGPEFKWTLAGHFHRRAPPHRIQRYLCHVCGRTFSTQTFSPDYYMKRPGLLVPVVAELVTGSADRQIARALQCAGSTVSRLVPRIARHEALFHAAVSRDLVLHEPVVIDDFESFVTSQLTQHAIAMPVGGVSWFIYDVDQALHYWGGRLSSAKRAEKRRLLETGSGPVRGARTAAFQRVLDRLLGRTRGELALVSDAHPVYAAVVARHPERNRIRHRVFPNTKRRKGMPRTPAEWERDAAMFPSDQFHRLLRHTLAHDHRETFAFARSVNMAVMRKQGVLVWRNYVKWASERKRWKGTAAMRVGLLTRRLRWAEIFRRRLFPAHIALPPSWHEAYHCGLATRGRIPSPRHRPAWAC